MEARPTVDIRGLDPGRDAGAVRDLYDRAADYVRLETGRAPDDATATAFFTDRAPDIDACEALKLGLFDQIGRLIAIADLAYGFPEREDAYLGLMLIDRDRRGLGLGRVFLADLVGRAERRGAPRLLLAVLDANPRGRAFWERQGFRVIFTAAPSRIGDKLHVRHRMARRLARRATPNL